MNTRLHPQAVQLHLFAEKRLCFGYFSAEAPTPESKVETTKESLAKLPPTVAKHVETQVRKLELKPDQIAQLTDPIKWVAALGKHNKEDGFDVAPAADPTKTNCDPDTLLQSMPQPDRKNAFMEFAKALIPQKIREDHPLFKDAAGKEDLILDPSTGDFTPKFAKSDDRKPLLNAMSGLFSGRGTENTELNADPGGEKDLAQKVLTDRYFVTDEKGDPVTKLDAEGNQVKARKTGLLPEMSGFAKGKSDARTIDEFKRGVPDSFLKGAIELGVVDNTDFSNIRPHLKALEAKHASTVSDVSRKLDTYMGTTEREVKEKSETVMDRFNKLPVIAKALIILGGLYLGYNNPRKATAAGIILGGMYFTGMSKNPINDTANFIGNIAGMGGSKVREWTGSWTGAKTEKPLTPQDIDQRARIYTKFLGKEGTQRLEKVLPLAAIGDVDFDVLARAYTPPERGTVGVFDHDNNAFRTAARASLKKNGIKMDITAPFDDDEQVVKPDGTRETRGQQNTRGLNEGFGELLFGIAALENREDAKLVTDAIAKLPEGKKEPSKLEKLDRYGQPYRDKNGNEYDPTEIYRRLVTVGHEIVLRKYATKTLNEYVFNNEGEKTPEDGAAAAADRAREALDKKVGDKAKLIDGYKYPAGVNSGMMASLLPSGEVEVKLVGATPAVKPIMINKAEFADMTPEQAMQRWKDVALGTIRAELAKEGPVLGSVLKVELAGNDVRFTDNEFNLTPHRLAKAPASIFFKKSALEINKAYHDWLFKKTADERLKPENKNPF